MPTQLLNDDSFTRANAAAGGTGSSTVGPGWIDEQGNTFSISSNQLLCQGNTQGMHYSRLLRQSSEVRRDCQVIVDFPTALTSAQVCGAFLRLQGDSLSRNCYACQIQWNSNVMQIWRTTWPSETSSVAVASIGSSAITGGFIAGHQYELTFSASGASPTTLTATLVDVTNSNTTVATISTTDSTAGYQAAGYMGVFGTNNTANIPFSRVRTYDIGAASLVAYGGSPATIGGPINVNSTGNVISLVGNSAAWTAGSPGSPSFTVSGGTGASITSQTVIDANHATVTINAGSATGPLTITDPSTGLTATVNVGTPVTVADPNLFFSPYNWYVNGSTYAQAANAGSYFKMGFSGTSFTLLHDLSPLTAAGAWNNPASTSGLGASGVSGTTSSPKLKFSIDNGTWQSCWLNATGITVLASGLSAGTHSIECYMQDYCGGNIDRWNTPSGVWRITGIRLDPTAVSSAPTLKPKRMLLYGDSITEGKLTILNPPNSAAYINDVTYCYSLAIAQALNAEVGICAYAGQATIGAGGAGATANVPPGLSTSGTPSQTTWDKYDANHSRLVGGLLSPAPDYIVNNMGTNDATDSAATLQAGYAAWLSGIRAAAPNALIFCFIPLNQNPNVAYIKAAINAFNDSKVYTVDLGAFPGLVYPGAGATQASSDGVHPTVYGHFKVAAVLAAAIQKQSDGQGGSVNPSTRQRHFS